MIVYSKKCPECDRESVSSFEEGRWLCPNCSEDITEVEAKAKEQ